MTEAFTDLLAPYLARQRWFAGGHPRSVRVIASETLDERLEWMIVDADGARYQLLVGFATPGEPPEFLHGHNDALLGAVDGRLAYDGLLDTELAKVVLGRVAPGQEATRVRPMGVEQSNTSLVLDDRLVLKVFRRLQEGTNPDVEVTAALTAVGFTSVAALVGTWTRDGIDLAVVQEYLASGVDGWALALASLRDYYGSEAENPADCGGDFAGEASRLGEVTARLHVSLADAFDTAAADPATWAAGMERQLERVGSESAWAPPARELFAGLREMTSAGRAVRVHGDYHLGQVLRTDLGWYVLDFEGEPARPLVERQAPASPLKDVAGMLRSFHYASAVALHERGEEERHSLRHRGEAWERRNRAALLDGYFSVAGVAELLPPDPRNLDLALRAWELDKAVYEVAYERDHRPDWVEIPELAIHRLLEPEGTETTS
ncbi:MAG: Maltokinase [uncultured Acidimicrobiales bacterium]|uniref:Maltokinase n=1 Tax=uncultured Acidimicrobiales bacterium TaxID=310071 RepID=A0A6J4GY28_9ACTN|nr:MAG: Maltokinase [uncultured Acidimicrobiales bacterium]